MDIMDKKEALQKMGSLNKNPDRVKFKLFQEGGRFFDPNDKL